MSCKFHSFAEFLRISESQIVARDTGNCRPETGKFPHHVLKFPKIPVPEITPKQAKNELSEVSFPLLLLVFRGLHSSGLQTATFYNRTNHKRAKSVIQGGQKSKPLYYRKTVLKRIKHVNEFRFMGQIKV